jgi:hypothetical protein
MKTREIAHLQDLIALLAAGSPPARTTARQPAAR